MDLEEGLQLDTGTWLGDYELLVPAASGGAASVWAARSGEQGVAVKVILDDFEDDPGFRTMFTDEARILQRIDHPNVCKVIAQGEQENTLYLVLEWIDGEPLQILIKESAASGGVPLHHAVALVRQACAGLHAVHEARGEDGELVGVVHRDVSLQNLMVKLDGTLKVIDFGVAKAGINRHKTTVGETKGKLAYMSPEQARGDVVDRRADVFSLGIVLFQLVTGKHPFAASSEFAMLRRIIGPEQAPRARTLVPDLPATIDEVIAHALSKDIDERFASMDELSRALELAMTGAPQPAKDLTSFVRERLGVRCERRRAAIVRACEMLAPAEPTTVESAGALAVPVPPPSPSSPLSSPRSSPLSSPGPVAAPEPAVEGPGAAAPKEAAVAEAPPQKVANPVAVPDLDRPVLLTPMPSNFRNRARVLGVLFAILAVAVILIMWSQSE
jgi:serine/threonine-protein kinase